MCILQVRSVSNCLVLSNGKKVFWKCQECEAGQLWHFPLDIIQAEKDCCTSYWIEALFSFQTQFSLCVLVDSVWNSPHMGCDGFWWTQEKITLSHEERMWTKLTQSLCCASTVMLISQIESVILGPFLCQPGIFTAELTGRGNIVVSRCWCNQPNNLFLSQSTGEVLVWSGLNPQSTHTVSRFGLIDRKFSWPVLWAPLRINSTESELDHGDVWKETENCHDVLLLHHRGMHTKNASWRAVCDYSVHCFTVQKYCTKIMVPVISPNDFQCLRLCDWRGTIL